MSTIMTEPNTSAPSRTRPIERTVRAATNPPTEHLALADRIRAAGVAIGPSVLLDLIVAAGIVGVATGRAFRPRTGPGRLVRPLALLGAAFPWAYFLAVRPWHRRWGATADEVDMPLPGDELVPEPGYQHTRAVTVRAPAKEVWPWLAQIGQDRGGFYSYDWLENLAGGDIHSADRIHPEWQDVEAGDPLAIVRGWGTRLAAVEPGRALVIAGWGAYAVRAIDANTSRLVARARQPKGWASLAYLLTVEIPHFVMERRMLLGIKERAERATGGRRLASARRPSDARASASPSPRTPPARLVFGASDPWTAGRLPRPGSLGPAQHIDGEDRGVAHRPSRGRPEALARNPDRRTG